MHPGPMPAHKHSHKHGPKLDFLQLSGQAQLSLKSTCITGILEAEAAYIMESVRRFIDATDDLVVQEAFDGS